MFNVSSSLSDVSDEIYDSSSIWNSAGLSSTELNPNLPEISKLSSQFNPNCFLPNSISEKNVGFNSFQNHGADFQFPSFTPTAFGTIGSKATFSPDPDRLNAKSLSPKAVSEPRSPTQPPVSKDPGYFSESECSSNSSERDTLSTSLAQSLHIDVTKTDSTSPVQPSPVQPSPVQPSPAQPSPVQPSPVQHQPSPVLLPLPDESWKTIKKPANKEKSIVPDLGDPSEGLWGRMSSPSWNMENFNKPSFVQSTKQQVCVFCRNNGEDPTVYTTHTLMSTAGKVICPILYAYKCPVCNATGDYAHTLKYCPVMPKGFSTPPNPPAMKAPGGARYPNLPKTATFPKHLSSTARANMTQNTFHPVPLGQQQQQQQQQVVPNLGNFNSIADLQEAAQKILLFTNQVLQNPGSGPPLNNPQISQFLLKLDKGNDNMDFGQSSRYPQKTPNNMDDFTKFLQQQQQKQRPPSNHFNNMPDRFSNTGRFPSTGFGGAPTFSPPAFNDYSPDNASNDLLKLLGVRKPECEGPAAPLPADMATPSEADKETTLARILANLREYETKKNY